MEPREERIREAAWQGRFYPADPETLRNDVDRYVGGAEAAAGGRVIGLVAPHAGYVYSGAVAGEAYAAVRAHPCGRVVLLAPSHRAAFRGVALWPTGAFRTPLGDVPVDAEGAARLLEGSAGAVRDLPEAHVEEHALEVQLPFLQVALGAFRLVPLLVGSHDLMHARSLADTLASLFGAADTLYVASSDLSHYHPYDTAVRIDRLFLDLLSKLEIERLAETVEGGEAEACGIGPVLTVASLARDHFGAAARLVRYANSGDTAGGKEEVVGYGAVLFEEGSEE